MSRVSCLPLLGILWLGWPTAGLAGAQPFDSPQTVDVDFADPETLRWEDLDGDGRVDLVASGGGGVVWWRESLGTWTKTTVSTAATTDLAIADLDRDGDLDLVAAHPATGLVWFANTAGDGSAWTTNTIQGAVVAMGVAVGDFDRDGKPDVAGALGGAVEWWRNVNGNGGTWARQLILNVLGANAVAASDLDLDGDLDLAVTAAATTDSVIFLRNNLPGFSRFDVRTGFDGARGLRVGDLDADGFPDLAAVSIDGGEIRWWRNDHTPSNGGWLEELVSSPAGARSVEVSDVDLDGDLDLVELAGDSLAWRENAPTLPRFLELRPVAAIGQARAAALADFDRDGDLDLAAGGALDDDLLVWRNQSHHFSVKWKSRVDLVAPLDGARAVDAADLDRDGDLDLVAVAYASHQILWVENLGQSWASHAVDTLTTAFGLRLGDLDRDGDVDLIGAGETANAVVWWRNELATGGTFTRLNLDTLLIGARGVAVGDLDRDGDLDVAACGTSDDVAIYLNNGSATAFPRTLVATTFNRPYSVDIADVDGDGDLDLLAAGNTADMVAWWENTAGDATSWAQRTISGAVLDGAYSVRTGDLDGDGDLDVISTAETADKISFWENLAGDGLTWSEQSLGFFNQAEAAVAADIDRDGDLDVVGAAWKDGGKVAYFRNNDGLGTSWTKLELTGAFDGAGSVVVGDFDRDGLPDVVATAETADLLSLFTHAGGQAGLTTTLTAATLPANSETGVFKLELSPRGGAGEGDVELATVELRLEEGVADPLSPVEANAVIDQIEILRDHPSSGVVGSLDAADFSIATLTNLLPNLQGVVTVPIPDGAAQAAVAQSSTGVFFVAVTTASNYASLPLAGLKLTLLPLASRIEDRDYDTGLRVEWAAEVASAIFPINQLADLSLDIVDAADPVLAGSSLSYQITLANAGPHTATSPALTLNLPAQSSLVATLGCNEDPGGVPTCTLANLPSGQQAVVTLQTQVAANAVGNLVMSAGVASSTFDPSLVNNAGSETTALLTLADLAVAIHADSGYGDGQPLGFEVVVTNLGPGPTLDAAVTVDLPSVLVGISFTCVGSGGASCTPTGGGGDLAESADLPAGGQVVYHISAQVPDGTSGSLQATATVNAGAGSSDGSLANNSDLQVWVWANPVFYDGFEVGNLDGWSAHVP